MQYFRSFHSIDIAKANVHGICFLQDIKHLIACYLWIMDTSRLVSKQAFLSIQILVLKRFPPNFVINL